MIARPPPRTRWPLVSVLAIGACFTAPDTCMARPERPPCPARCVRVASRVAYTSEPQIDRDCPGPMCPASSERGAVRVGPSFHPAVSAIVLEGDSQVAITVETLRRADGTQVAGLTRCEEGGALVLLGDRDTAIRAPVVTEREWSPFAMVVREPSSEISSIDGIGAETTTIVRFANTGSAACLLTRVRFETLENVCGQLQCEPDGDADAGRDASRSDGSDPDVDGPDGLGAVDAGDGE
jgi:hypothetical protein